MAENKTILQYNYNGTGTEIPPINVDLAYQEIWLQGSDIAQANYPLTFLGTPVAGTTVVIKNFGTLDLGLIPYTFTIFGFPVTQTQLFNNSTFTLSYDGISWRFNVVTTQTSGFPTITSNDIVSLNGTKIESGTLDLGAAGIALSLDTTKIADLGVTTPKINNLAVTDAKINDVDGSKIANASIVDAKLATMPDGYLKGNNSGMGAQSPSDIEIATLFNTNVWKLGGNDTTTPGTHFVGTKDNQDLVFKINNTESGRLNLANSNVSFGLASLITNTLGVQNIAFGVAALSSNTSGSYNSAVGYSSLGSNLNGDYNVGVGNYALGTNSTGTGNTGIGAFGLQNNVSGVNNTALGYGSLSNVNTSNYNVGIGASAAITLTTGSNNTIVGTNADVTNPATTNSIALGFNAVTTLDNQFALPDTVTDWKIRGNNFTLPASDGAANAVLQTDGAGTLSFGKIVDSGAYIPTAVAVTNISAISVYVTNTMRVGNVATVFGKITITNTAAASTPSELTIDLPFSTTFNSDYQCAGSAVSNVFPNPAIRIKADMVSTTKASFVWNAETVTADDYSFNFTYLII